MGDLTANFSASEFNTDESAWPDEYAENLVPLAQLAQWVRDDVGTAGEITSAYRTPAENTADGGSATSQHLDGQAIDLVFPLASIQDIARAVLDDVASGVAPAFGQVILYPSDGHVHVSLPTLGSRDGQILLETGPNQFEPFTDMAQLPMAAELPSALPQLEAAATGGASVPWSELAIIGGILGALLVLGCRPFTGGG